MSHTHRVSCLRPGEAGLRPALGAVSNPAPVGDGGGMTARSLSRASEGHAR